jgi:uncharacterized protein YkwD
LPTVTARLQVLALSGITALLVLFVPVGAGVAFGATSPCAGTTTTTTAAMNATIVVLLNRDRKALGLPPVTLESRLTAVGIARAHRLATTGILSHEVAGPDIGVDVRHCGVRANMAGEAIGWTATTLGRPAARWLYWMWKHSPEHWGLMTDRHFVRIGVGWAYRSGAGQTWSSLVLATAS